VQVTAAHTRRFYLEHYVAGTRRGVGEVAQLELPVADKHDAFHAILPRVFSRDARWVGVRQAPAYHERRMTSGSLSAANTNARTSVVLLCCPQSEGLNSLLAHDLATTSSWNRRMASTVRSAKLKSIAFTPSSRMARRSSMISALLPENRNRSPLSAFAGAEAQWRWTR